MANENKIMEILRSGYDQKLLGVKEKNICLTDTLNTANKILYLLNETESLNIEQIIKRLNLNQNTVYIYMRVLKKMGFVKSIKKENSKELIFYLSKKISKITM